MSDLISRQLAIDAIRDLPDCPNGFSDTYDKARIVGALEGVLSAQPDLDTWKEVYAESDGNNSWIEFQCPHCGETFGIESGQYGWHYTDPIPWKACPMCGGPVRHER